MHYEGHAFNEGFEKGKASGRISTSRAGVTFRNDTSDVLLPLNGLKLELGGASNRILFITNPSVPDWKLYTTDHKLLKDPLFANNISSQQQIKSVKSTKSKAKIIGLVTLLILFFGIG